jgi:hypothetical protein
MQKIPTANFSISFNWVLTKLKCENILCPWLETEVSDLVSVQRSKLLLIMRCFIIKKGKVVPVLNLTPSHEGVLGEWRYSSTHSLTSAPDGGEWSASRSGRFTPRERAFDTHWIGGWVGPRAVLDAMVKTKIPSPRRESNSRIPVVPYLILLHSPLANNLRNTGVNI